MLNKIHHAPHSTNPEDLQIIWQYTMWLRAQTRQSGFLFSGALSQGASGPGTLGVIWGIGQLKR